MWQALFCAHQMLSNKVTNPLAMIWQDIFWCTEHAFPKCEGHHPFAFLSHIRRLQFLDSDDACFGRAFCGSAKLDRHPNGHASRATAGAPLDQVGTAAGASTGAKTGAGGREPDLLPAQAPPR